MTGIRLSIFQIYENDHRHPGSAFQKVKIRAIERGQPLKQIVLTSLEKNLTDPATATATVPYFARRKLTPEFAAAEESGLNKLTPGSGSIKDIIADIKDDVLL